MNDRRRYLSLGVLALTLSLAYGIWYSYGVLMVALLHEYGWSRSVLAGAFSVFTLTHGFANPVIGWLCERMQPPRLVAYGGVALGCSLWGISLVTTPWQLYVMFGVFTAVAVAAAGWVPALVQTQRRFPDRLGLALGIVSSGVGLGMLLVVPLCQLLFDAFGWRTAMRALGVGCIVWIVPASLYLLKTDPARPEMTTIPADAAVAESTRRGGPKPLTLREAMRTAPFWLIVAAFFLGNVCSQTMHVHQVAFLVDHGVTALVAASVVGVVGGSSMVAKIASGWISDRIDREIVYITCIAIMVAAVGALLAVGANPSTAGAFAYAVLFGAGYSVTASLTPAMASDRFSGPHFASIVGFGLFGSALGSALGPWLAGLLFDLTGSYTIPLLIAAACGLLAVWSGWMLRRLRLREMRGIAAPVPGP